MIVSNHIVEGVVVEKDGTRLAVAADTIKKSVHIGIAVRKDTHTASVSVLNRDQLLEHITTCKLALTKMDETITLTSISSGEAFPTLVVRLDKLLSLK